jgi:dGTP triphosphohydrolase
MTLEAGSADLRGRTYAIDPDHTTTYTIRNAFRRPRARVTVNVSNLRRLKHTTQELVATATTRS